jgi:hypothetical protein
VALRRIGSFCSKKSSDHRKISDRHFPTRRGNRRKPPNRTLNLGGIGGASALFFLSPARPLHSPDAIRVIAWPRFGYAKFRSRSHDATIRVYDDAGNVMETQEHKGRVQGVVMSPRNAQKKPRACKRRSQPLRLAEFLEARIIPERIEHWIEPK